jgi:hypothetical protein
VRKSFVNETTLSGLVKIIGTKNVPTEYKSYRKQSIFSSVFSSLFYYPFYWYFIFSVHYQYLADGVTR